MSKSTRTHDVTATIGEYKNAQGETKKRYINVGSAFTDEQGRVSIKMDAVPVSPEWSSWLSLYPVEDRGGKGGQQQAAPARERGQSTQQRAHAATQQKGWDAHDAVNDDLPF